MNPSTTVSTTVRQSNFELLRILSMAGVLMNHTIRTLWNIFEPELSWPNGCRIFLMSWAVLAVNCFILISGYFTIKLSWKGVVKYYAQCFFYMALFVGMSSIINHSLTITDLSKVVFACSESHWFIYSYFVLMLASPLLNKAIRVMDMKQMRGAIILLLLVDVYLGYIHLAPEIAPMGYELTHFAIMYLLGNYISRTPVRRAPWGLMLLGIVLLMTLLHILKWYYPLAGVIYSQHYNSPCLIAGSLIMFLWARTWTIQSKVVNWCAGGVFAVYLIHFNEYFQPYFWSWLRAIRDMGTFYTIPVLLTVADVLFFSLFILIDKLRFRIFHPLEIKIADLLSATTSSIRQHINIDSDGQ